MKLMDVGVHRYPMASPADTSELRSLIESGQVKAEEIVAIIAQTEGDGYSRGYATLAHELMFSEFLGISGEEVFDRIPMLMIGLTGGIMSPHATMFSRRWVEGEPAEQKRFVIGVQNTRVLKPEEYGTRVHAEEVAKAVRAGMAEAGIDGPEDVHCVEVKCPNLTPERIADCEARGAKLITTNLANAGTRSKAASALGVAVGLGEVADSAVTNESINSDWSLYSNVASTSAGAEQKASRVLVMGNSTRSASPFVIGNGVMKDQLDLEGAKQAFRNAGLTFAETIPEEMAKRVATVFVNSGGNAVPAVRGRRHTMNSDYLASYAGVFAKAVANAVVASLIGDPMILASAGFEHQGKRGENLVAVIARAE